MRLLAAAVLALVLPACKKEVSFAPTLVCPPGTKPTVESLSAEASAASNWAQYEEYCRHTETGQRHGPYLVWGANGEKLVEGQWIEGKEHGLWTRRAPSQTVRETWTAGVRGPATVGTRQGFDFIDVKRCVRHSYDYRLVLGRASVFVEPDGDTHCKIVIKGEIAQGELAPRVCRVPRPINRVPLVFREGTIDLSFSDNGSHCTVERDANESETSAP
jgi:hypothetical protein